jgi:hypothetical protein
MIRVSSDTDAAKIIVKSMILPWHDQKTVGSKVADLLRDRLAVVSAVNVHSVLEPLRETNHDFYLALIRYIDSGLLKEVQEYHQVMPVSGVRKNLNITLSKVFSQEVDFHTAAIDKNIIQKYRDHVVATIFHPDDPLYPIEREFGNHVIQLNDGNRTNWKNIFDKYRHASSTITIVDQYLFNEKTDIEAFIHGLLTQSSKPLTIRLVSKRAENEGVVKAKIAVLKKTIPGCTIDLYTFGSNASKKIHDREVLTDSLYMFMGSGLDTINRGTVQKDSLITVTGRYYLGGSPFSERSERILNLLNEKSAVRHSF